MVHKLVSYDHVRYKTEITPYFADVFIDPIQKHFKLKYLYLLFNLFKVYELKRYINLEPWIFFFFCKNDMY